MFLYLMMNKLMALSMLRGIFMKEIVMIYLLIRNQESDIDPSGTDIGQGGTLSMDIKNNTSNYNYYYYWSHYK